MEDNLVGLTKAALRITPLSRKPLVSICMHDPYRKPTQVG
jgi:hypothetical protein